MATTGASAKDYTSGPILKNIVLFALPIMLTSILQRLYNSADQIVIGRFSGTESLAAVGSNSALLDLLLNLFLGLTMGTNVVMARAIGAKNYEKAERVVHTSMLLGVFVGLFLSVTCFFMARVFLTLMKCDSAVIDKATTYLRIYFLGLPATVIYNFGSAILRAKGDTKRPLIFLAVSGAVNVGLNLLFVIAFNMDVAGVALATTISQYLSLALILICLFKQKDFCVLKIRKLRIEKEELVDIVYLGVPAGLSGSCFSLGNIIMQSAVNTLGATAMAAGSVSATLDGFVYFAMASVPQSAVTFIGQNYGARNARRIKIVLFESLLLVTAVGLVVTGIELALLRPIISLFTTDSEVAKMVEGLLKIYIPLYFVCGIMDVLGSALRGIGRSIVPAITSIIFVFVFRIVWTYAVFPHFLTLVGLYISHPISWIVCSTCYAITFAICFNKLKNKFLCEEKYRENFSQEVKN